MLRLITLLVLAGVDSASAGINAGPLTPRGGNGVVGWESYRFLARYGLLGTNDVQYFANERTY